MVCTVHIEPRAEARVRRLRDRWRLVWGRLPRRTPLSEGAAFWLATRIALAVFTVVAVVLMDPQARNPGYVVDPQSLITRWGNWDGAWYTGIARGGYNPIATAFFPLFPLLIKLFGSLAGVVLGGIPTLAPLTWLIGGLIASNLSLLVGFVAIAALARHEFGESGDSWRALALTAAYPFAFFLTAVYPQATFLATAGLALLFARTGRWLAAAAAGYLAGLTHQTTVILILPLAWEFLAQHGWLHLCRRGRAWARRLLDLGTGILVVGAVPLGVLTYMAWLRQTYGNPLLFQWAITVGWGRHLATPWWTAHAWLNTLVAFHAWSPGQLMLLLEGGLWAGATVATLVLIRRVPFSFTLYMAGLLLLSVVSPPGPSWHDPISGTGRFLTGAIPLFVGLAGLLRNRAGVQTVLVGCGVLLQGILAAAFLTGGWLG